MNYVGWIIGWVVSAGGLAGALYAIACVFAASWFAKTTKPRGAPPVPVTVLKPRYGAEAQLSENLERFCRQDYAAPMQLLFGVQQRAQNRGTNQV
jgi:ceramide glucosyltransferase